MPGTIAISVVMGSNDDNISCLQETVQSVLAQTYPDFEFIIINDGSTKPQVRKMLESVAERDTRIRLISKKNEGLTKALIDGCNFAAGKYIARIDVGDVMLPERLLIQKNYLDTHPAVGFVSCWTEFCGPEWEHLYLEKGQSERLGLEPVDITPAIEERGLSAGPTHHGSVMFRKSSYEEAGGYQWQFYYAQDWDLWYRLSSVSGFALLPETLYRCRIFPDGISARHVEEQSLLARLYKQAYWQRRRGVAPDEVLAKASFIRPGPYTGTSQKQHLSGNYFIGSMLRKNKDRHCLVYFSRELKQHPCSVRLWIAIVRGIIGI